MTYYVQRDPYTAISMEIPQNKRVLVVGCGRGIHVLDIAVSTSHDVAIVAVDASAEKLKMAQELLQQFPEVNRRVTFIKANVVKFTSEHKFDMILDANLVHYFTKEQASAHVKNMVTLLKENGHLFMFWQPGFSEDPEDTFLKQLQPRPQVLREWATNEGWGVQTTGKAVQFKTSTEPIRGAPEIRSIHFQKTYQRLSSAPPGIWEASVAHPLPV